jgi:hypothetical protein
VEALARSLCRTSMAIMKSIGERESPCCTPRRCLIGGPYFPFSIILEDAVDNSAEIQEHHLSPNPGACRSSSKNGHERVSNALDMSSFSSSIEIFFFRMSTDAR